MTLRWRWPLKRWSACGECGHHSWEIRKPWYRRHPLSRETAMFMGVPLFMDRDISVTFASVVEKKFGPDLYMPVSIIRVPSVTGLTDKEDVT